MNHEVELSGNVIEFSIGLAEFSGVIAAFANRTRWTSLETYRLINLLFASLILAFASFISLGVIGYGSQWSDNPWQTSCLILLILVATLVYRAFSGRNDLPDDQRILVNAKLFVVLNLMILGVGLVQVLGLIGMLRESTFLGFYFGLVTILFVGVVLFGVAILSGAGLKEDPPVADVADVQMNIVS